VASVAAVLAAGSVIGLAGAGAASASSKFTNTFEMGFSTSQPSVSAGLHTHITWSDPGAPFGVPPVLRRIAFRFPAGTEFSTAALPTCSAPDFVLLVGQVAACPANSRIGSGSTIGELPTGTQLHTRVTLFNGPGQIIVLVTFAGLTATVFRDDVGSDAITVNPFLPPGVSLADLDLTIDPHTSAANIAYLRTPPSCPAAGGWPITAEFSYTNGATDSRESRSPCQAAKHQRPRRHRHHGHKRR
jgi:hypothetical protein